MEWLFYALHNPDRKALAREIAADAVARFGSGAIEHLDALRQERPNLLWLRALLRRAIREVRRFPAGVPSTP